MKVQPLYQILSQADLSALVAEGYITNDDVVMLAEQAEQDQIDADWSKLVKQRCAALLAERNEAIAQARQLRKAILAHGGISKSDYESIPASYKRKTGYSLDEIAQELKYTDDAALMLDIDAAENALRQLPTVNGKRVSRYRLADMIDEAEASLIAEYGRIGD